MEALKIKGKLKEVKGVETFKKKDGTEVTKQGFILTTENEYNPDIYFEVFKDKVMLKLQEKDIGDIIEVSFNLTSREYNGKYYHNVNAWLIKSIEEEVGVDNETKAPF
jgi:hypothetical protein